MASLLLKCCFFLLHPIYLGNIVATKKKNIMEICGIKVMKKILTKKYENAIMKFNKRIV